jgi:hypothetical protein
MKMSRFSRLAGLMVLALAMAAAEARAARADVPPVAQRATIVEKAARFAEAPVVEPLASDLVNPFNPEAFGQPDPEELRAIEAARAAAAAAAGQAPVRTTGVLERIAERISPSGTLELNGQPYLIFGQKRLRVGDLLTVTFEGRDYTLELVAIDRVTFTLRHEREQITRPIQPGK